MATSRREFSNFSVEFSSDYLFNACVTLTVMFLTPVEIQIAIIKLKYWTLILSFDPEIGSMLTLKCITAHQNNKYLKNRKSQHENLTILNFVMDSDKYQPMKDVTSIMFSIFLLKC